MTFEEALLELEVAASCTPAEARRAYLRLVRTRKPETDPEGFKRLRQAYEIVAGALERRAAQGDAPAPLPEADDKEEASTAAAYGPPELAALTARLSALPAESHREERLEILREVVRDHSQSAGARWWLAQELADGGREEELVEVLRQGSAAGFPGFLERRALWIPASLDADDLSRLESSGDPEVLAIAALVRLRHRQRREATALLDRAIDLLRTPSGESRSAPPLLLRGILSLDAEGAAGEARALHDHLWAWLSGSGDRDLLRRYGADRWWPLVHELGLLDPAFPRKLRQAIAQAVLLGDPSHAVKKARGFAWSHRRQAERASELLYNLPILYDLLFGVLQEIEPDATSPDQPGRKISVPVLLRFAVVLVFAGAIALSQQTGSRAPRPGEEKSLAAEFMGSYVKTEWNTFRAACEVAPRTMPPTLCEPGSRAVAAIQGSDCPAARAAIKDLELAAAGAGAGEAGAFQARGLSTHLTEVLDHKCPP